MITFVFLYGNKCLNLIYCCVNDKYLKRPTGRLSNFSEIVLCLHLLHSKTFRFQGCLIT